MDFVFTKLQKYVLDLVDFYEVKISNEVFDMLINEFLTLGYMLNGADLEIFLANCKSGKYKNRVDIIEGREFTVKFFKLTPDVLIEWLKIYIHERSEAFATTQIKPKKPVTLAPTEVELIEIMANASRKNEAEIVEEPKPNYFEPAKKLQSFLEAEFKTNELIERSGDWKELPYVMFGELRLTKHEYIAARFNQLYENWYSEYSQIETEITVTDFLTNQINNLTQ